MRPLLTIPPDERDAWVGVLELADEAEPLRRTLHEGTLFAWRDDTGAPLAAILVLRDSDDAELRAVAVAEVSQGQGVGRALVGAVLDALRSLGVRRVVVGTASSGTRQLAFYQRTGFRLTHVERDYFNAERGYDPELVEDGIPVRDMVWMAQDL
jgi:GNAT superfamily N-acetyltransferase